MVEVVWDFLVVVVVCDDIVDVKEVRDCVVVNDEDDEGPTVVVIVVVVTGIDVVVLETLGIVAEEEELDDEVVGGEDDVDATMDVVDAMLVPGEAEEDTAELEEIDIDDKEELEISIN